MKTKWYISACIAILALWGIVHNHTSFPNQEVLVRFHDKEVSLEQTSAAIAFIESELKVLEVTNIQVEKGADNQLKISYHSNLDVVAIQEVLSKASKLQKGLASRVVALQKSSKSDKDAFDVAVQKIEKASQSTSSSEKSAVITKHDYDRFTNTHLLLYFNEFVATVFLPVKYSINSISSKQSLVITHKTYTIPEVRAGPFTISTLA